MLLGIKSCSGTSLLDIALPWAPDLWTAAEFRGGEEDSAFPWGLQEFQQSLGRTGKDRDNWLLTNSNMRT